MFTIQCFPILASACIIAPWIITVPISINAYFETIAEGCTIGLKKLILSFSAISFLVSLNPIVIIIYDPASKVSRKLLR